MFVSLLSHDCDTLRQRIIQFFESLSPTTEFETLRSGVLLKKGSLPPFVSVISVALSGVILCIILRFSLKGEPLLLSLLLHCIGLHSIFYYYEPKSLYSIDYQY